MAKRSAGRIMTPLTAIRQPGTSHSAENLRRSSRVPETSVCMYELVDRLDCALLHALIRDTVEKWSPSVLHNLITTMGCDLKPRRCVRLADTPGNRHARRRRQARICRRAVFQVPRRRKSQASASPDCALARAIIVAASAPAIHPSS